MSSPRTIFGIEVGSASNLVAGNFIGTTAAGNAPLGDTFGISLDGSAQSNVLSNNVVAGNHDDGIDIYGPDNLLVGNFIGTNAQSAANLGNDGDGIQLFSSTAYSNTIGGLTVADRNIISGNIGGSGIELNSSATTGNLVEGNFIGTNVAGTAALGNSSGGIAIDGESVGNTIGGSAAGAGNLISGNISYGVYVSSNNLIAGNFIGTDSSGTIAVPNTQGGSGCPWQRQHHRRHDEQFVECNPGRRGQHGRTVGGLSRQRHQRQQRRRRGHRRQRRERQPGAE